MHVHNYDLLLPAELSRFQEFLLTVARGGMLQLRFCRMHYISFDPVSSVIVYFLEFLNEISAV